MSARGGNGNGNGAPRRPRAKRPRGGGFRRFLRRLAVLALLLALAVAAAGWWGWRSLAQPYAGFRGEQRVNVEPGTSGLAILATLEREGVIRDARLARVWLLAQGDPSLQAGEYLFRAPLSTPDALGKVIRGDVVAHRVTVLEGLTLEETADRLVGGAAAATATPSSLSCATPSRSPTSTRAPKTSRATSSPTATPSPPRRRRAPSSTPWSPTSGVAGAAEVTPRLTADGGRTMREVVTLASIVEKEAKAAAERPLIAAVYANRLERGMGLFADPTVIFALKRLGRWDGNIRKADLALDSPYNTYKHAGLPPGPICSSGTGALAAAAAPADVPYLYFVSKNDGTHVFATTLDEHNRNVSTWQRRYWRDRRAAERAAGSPSPPARGRSR